MDVGTEVVVVLFLGVVEGIAIVVYSIRNPPPFTLESDLNLKIGTQKIENVIIT